MYTHNIMLFGILAGSLSATDVFLRFMFGPKDKDELQQGHHFKNPVILKNLCRCKHAILMVISLRSNRKYSVYIIKENCCQYQRAVSKFRKGVRKELEMGTLSESFSDKRSHRPIK